MTAYWLLFGYFAAGAFLTGTRPRNDSAQPLLLFGWLLTALAIGLRYKVGADWQTYEFIFEYAGQSLSRALERGDPAYQLLNWSVQQTGGEVWLVNLICGVIFTWGLARFVRAQPNPWLAMVVAVPYLIIVVAMGYSRQAVALGILMAGLASVQGGGGTLKFAVYVAVAALFHKTAVAMFPLVAFSAGRSRMINLLVTIAVGVLLYDYFLGDQVTDFVSHYIRTGYSSQGAGVRVGLNVLAASLFLLNRKKLGLAPREQLIWRNFSIAAFLMLALLFSLPSSTAVDRISLYLIPLQIVTLARLPYGGQTRGMLVGLVGLYSALILLVWLNFAVHAKYWIPYQLYPIFNEPAV